MKTRAAWFALLAATPLVAAAQGRGSERCSIDGDRQTSVQLPSTQRNTFIGGNVLVRCPTSDLTLRADSLEQYGDEGRIYLLGNVHYAEPRLTLSSTYLTYYQRDERIVANGNVNAVLPSGSSMQGPTAEYFRAIPGTRPATRLYSSGRPTYNIVQKDSSGGVDTLVVNANTVLMIGDSLVYAGGNVVATRPEVEARGDSMTVDSEREIMVMMRNPVIEGLGDRPFSLFGDRIELTSEERELRRVLSLGNARALSEDMTLASDTIDLRVEDDLLQRAMAWGPSRARVTSPTQRISADSINVRMPDQQIREMFAVGAAIAEGDPDTARFQADTVDWMRGDTIIARFDSSAAADSANATRLQQLVALGSARSYHHMAPSDTSLHRPAINYVRGREIIVSLEEQEVSKVTVVEQAAGVYLEPRPLPVSPPVAPGTGSPTRTIPPTPRPR